MQWEVGKVSPRWIAGQTLGQEGRRNLLRGGDTTPRQRRRGNEGRDSACRADGH